MQIKITPCRALCAAQQLTLVLQPLSPWLLIWAEPVPPYTWPSERQLKLGLAHLASPVP